MLCADQQHALELRIRLVADAFQFSGDYSNEEMWSYPLPLDSKAKVYATDKVH